MQRSRLHILATTIACAATLTIAGCATAAIPGGTAAPRTTAVSSDTSSRDSGEVAGVAVTGADGYAERSLPIDEIADTPAVANLVPELRSAVTHATEAARADGVTVLINSGWRSARYQQALLDQGIEEHGSLQAARRWVNTPERSTHVTGNAVDVGAWDAAAWMQEHGPEFGLCQTYANESWHYELTTEPGGECPAMLDDSSEG